MPRQTPGARLYSAPAVAEALSVVSELHPDSLAQHLDRLYRAAWALTGSREDAEDLVQDTCAKVLAKPRAIARQEDALPYLLRVLRNTFVSGLRTRSRRPQTAPLEDSEARLAAPASASPVAVLTAREVYAAIAALPEDQREVIAAVDVAGLSYIEAAEALRIPTGTVMSRLYRGRNRVAAAVG
jgi:RNA polymerase sigma-70 factor (ECF subfamily)